MGRYSEADLTGVRTYSAADRPSKVQTFFEAKPLHAGMAVSAFLDALPDILRAKDLKTVAAAIVRARQDNKPVIVMIGGHVIKAGCSPVLAGLMDAGFVTHLASNGAAAIHDAELALFGHTSEDVGAQLEDGSFGMAADTAELVNRAAGTAARQSDGFGETVGRLLVEADPPHLQRALIGCAYQNGIPYTLHVAMGTDIVHQHPTADGAAIGEASHRDFRILAASVSHLTGGGVVLNLGSAVILPEVFLKALSVARNLKPGITGFTTVNMDMIQHYRPSVNVVQRPVMTGGAGYAITGHHEIMIPLLAAAVYEIAARTS
ncbi:MAG: hypothetical protein CSA22_06575 [Deltaproteobacteria bacterium]|nr:MAG: hypothetical protein CSA22_06575 [Deltaproteobacteria bacterium]